MSGSPLRTLNMLKAMMCALLLAAGVAPAAASSRALLAVDAAAAPAPQPGNSTCIANPSAPIDDPPAFPTMYLGGCKRCSEDGSACEECHPWFGLTSDGRCVKCPRNGPEGYICLDCLGDDPTHCLSCAGNLEVEIVPGLYASEDGECLRCGEGCAECSNLNGTCTSCTTGYGLMDDGECVQCEAELGENVQSCDGDASRASSCAWGYSVDAQKGTCFECAVENCADCSAPGACETCRDGYGFGKGGKCVECKIAGCTACADDAEKSCTECNGGAYALPANATSCTPCADPSCTACDEADKCTYCQEGSVKGVDSSTGACVSCLDENCTLCPQDAGFCWSCRDGWRMNPGTGGCTACGTVPNCATCDTDEDTGGEQCTGCKAGFELQYADPKTEEYLDVPVCVAAASS